MKITNYIASLLPSFGKTTVMEDVRLTRTEIKEATLPVYEAAVPLLGKWKFKSKVLQAQIAIFDRMVKSSGNDNIVVTIHKAFKPILENLDAVEVLVSKTYNEDVAGLGLTYAKANLLQFVECVSFVSKYARKFLIYIYVCETACYLDIDVDKVSSAELQDNAINESLSKAELSWLESNFVTFCTALNIASGNPAHIKKQLEDIPDIVITAENAGTLGSTVGEHKLDPLQMKLIPIWMNPIYHIGMFVAEWQAERYKAAKEEVRLVQLRKLNLEKLSEGKPDAHVQQQIAYMESRIQGLNYKLAKMERDHA